MEYLILMLILICTVVVLKAISVIVKASKRVNLIYTYFILDGNTLPKNLEEIASRNSPNPNDGGGCPTESELLNEQ